MALNELKVQIKNSIYRTISQSIKSLNKSKTLLRKKKMFNALLKLEKLAIVKCSKENQKKIMKVKNLDLSRKDH